MTRTIMTVACGVCVAMLAACAPGPGDASAKSIATPENVAASPSSEPSPSPTEPESASPPAPSRSAPRKRSTPPGPHGSLRFTGSASVALTFDDGPSPRWTPKVLALLKTLKVKATFCLIGQEAKRRPALVRAIARDGHAFCNHSWAHDMDLGGKAPTTIMSNMLRTNEAIRDAAPDAEIDYYRQPGGRWTARLVHVSKSLGLRPLHWDVDPQDWRRPPAEQISSFVIRETKKGSIVLLHDGGGHRGATYEALKKILPNLTRRFQLVSL